jgi:hypothetical protein
VRTARRRSPLEASPRFLSEPLRSPLANYGESQALRPTAAPATLSGAAVAGNGVTLETRAMDIGEPRRTHTVEPLEDPVPRELPD